MNILNFGSLNIDHVYRLPRFVRPGETVSCASYDRFCGGKGLNQSIALARAGANVFHAGKVGPDGGMLVEALSESGVDVRFVETGEVPTGHAVIQVDDAGENAIFLYGGANQTLTAGDADRALAHFGPGDLLLAQNETSAVAEALSRAKAKGLTTAFNPAPMGPEVAGYPLSDVDILILNETEAEGLVGKSLKEGADEALLALRGRCPAAKILLTLGSRGAVYAHGDARIRAEALAVKAVDTTAAGDAFIGYFLASLARGLAAEKALKLACRAAALCVTRPGASPSIPYLDEAERFTG